MANAKEILSITVAGGMAAHFMVHPVPNLIKLRPQPEYRAPRAAVREDSETHQEPRAWVKLDSASVRAYSGDFSSPTPLSSTNSSCGVTARAVAPRVRSATLG